MYASRYREAEKCGRCGKEVYAMYEQVIAAGSTWHKNGCFNCAKCGTGLEMTTFNDKDGEIYCSGCVGEAFSPKDKDVDTSRYEEAEKCFRCGREVYAFHEQVIAAGSTWHQTCFSCATCGTGLQSTTFNEKAGQFYCKGCFGEDLSRKERNVDYSRYGEAEKCGRCGKAVYAMYEQVIAAGSTWHKNDCFSCATCGTGLEMTTYNDKDGEIYCSGCFERKSNPRERNMDREGALGRQ